jgi:hypothetical protein
MTLTIKQTIDRLRNIYRFLRLVRQFFKKEIELHGWRITPQRMKYIRLGFHSDKKHLYEHGENGLPLPAYLTDFERLRTKSINSRYKDALDNKILFTQVFESLFKCPRNYGFLESSGRYMPMEPSTRKLRGRGLRGVVEAIPTPFVLKLIGGGGGKDVFIVQRETSKLLINGRESSLEDLDARIDGRKFLVMEFIEQGEYAGKLYPGSVNTVRVVTALDEHGPWIVFAIQRIGRTESAPTDNFNQGGICSVVDLETGEIGKALYYSGNSRPDAFVTHPDTEEPLVGKVVPYWGAIKTTLLKAVSQYPGFRYVGWDVVLQDDGFLVLEGNSYPGVQVLQLHRPLLENRRLARLFARNRVFSRQRTEALGLDWSGHQAAGRLMMNEDRMYGGNYHEN